MLSPAHGLNDQRFKDLVADVKEDARTQAKGARGRAIMFGRLVHAAVDGVIDTTKDKHGKGIDDAKFLYEEHLKAYSAKDPGKHVPNGQKANASKCRQAIQVGQMTTIDGKHEFQRIASTYFAAQEVDPKAVRPEFETYVAWARTQIKNSDQPLTDEQLKELVAKPEPASKELADFWAGISKQIDAVISGENRSGLKDQSEESIAIGDAVRGYTAGLTLCREQDALMAKARELGLDVSKPAVEVAVQE